MGLNAKQVEFTYTMAKFLVWCHENGFECFGAEWFRTNEQAEIYAKQGKGIKNSVHRKKLAVDLFRVKNGKLTWDKGNYVEMGAKWKSMHDLARWGGDFKRRDSVHFSFEHNGVM
jgi:hypothetical protein